jgi:hypothetical protein
MEASAARLIETVVADSMSHSATIPASAIEEAAEVAERLDGGRLTDDDDSSVAPEIANPAFFRVETDDSW